MRRRLRPQAALTIALPGAVVISAAVGLYHGPTTAFVRPPDQASPLPTIDAILSLDDDGCAGVRSTVWHPLSGLEYTGRLRIILPPHEGGAILLFIGDSIPLDIAAEDAAGAAVPIARERLASPLDLRLPPDYWMEDGDPWSAPHPITRVSVDAARASERTVLLSLGRRAPRVVARLTGYPADVRVPVCADAIAAGDVRFATGWYGRETSSGPPVRWMRGQGAVLVSSSAPDNVQVVLSAAPATVDAAGRGTMLTLRVNDVYQAAPIAMQDGFRRYDFAVPARAWVDGVNELLLTVSATREASGRTLGLALREPLVVKELR